MILEDSEAIMHHVTKKMGYKEENVIISGRSLGSGPSIHLASRFKKIKLLVLVSPFLSIKGVVRNVAGKVAAMIMKERFDNIKKIGEVSSPVLIIHSKKDKLVPFSHSQELKSKKMCNFLGNCRGVCTVIDNVLESHKVTDIYRQYINPVSNFLNLIDMKR